MRVRKMARPAGNSISWSAQGPTKKKGGTPWWGSSGEISGAVGNPPAGQQGHPQATTCVLRSCYFLLANCETTAFLPPACFKATTRLLRQYQIHAKPHPQGTWQWSQSLPIFRATSITNTINASCQPEMSGTHASHSTTAHGKDKNCQHP